MMRFHEDRVPLDVLVTDLDWLKTFGSPFEMNNASRHRNDWSGKSWDNALFPDPRIS